MCSEDACIISISADALLHNQYDLALWSLAKYYYYITLCLIWFCLGYTVLCSLKLKYSVRRSAITYLHYRHTQYIFFGKFVNRQNRGNVRTTIFVYPWWSYIYIIKVYYRFMCTNVESTTNTLRFHRHTTLVSFIFLFTITTNKPICIWKLSENLPFNIWTRTDIGLAFDGAHVYRPESLCIAFWTKSRLVVSLPFSVTKEMPPLGESKFITWKRTKAQKNEIK